MLFKKLFILMLLTASAVLGAEQQIRVSVDMDIETDYDRELYSLIRRELRSLGDVILVNPDENAEECSIRVVQVELSDKRGYAVAYSLLEFPRDTMKDLMAYIPKNDPNYEMWRDITAELHGCILGMMVCGSDGLDWIARQIVVKLDTEFLDYKRKF